MVIGLSQVATSLSAFLLLPVLTKSLGPEDYGLWIQLSILVSLLTPIGQMCLQTAMVRYLAAEKDDEAFRDTFYSTLIFVLVVTGIVSLILVIISGPLATSLFDNGPVADLIRASAALLMASAIEPIVLFYFRIVDHPKVFSVLTILKAASQLALTALFIAFGMGILGVIMGSFLAIGIEAGMGLALIERKIGFRVPTFKMTREMLRFSFPIVPNGLISWIATSSDRFLIGIFLGVGLVGIYSASYSLGAMILLFSSPIQFILYPTLSKLYDEGRKTEVSSYISHSIRAYLLITIPAAVGIAVLAPFLLAVMTTEEFAQGASVVPLIALSCLLSGLFLLVQNVVVVVKKTKLFPVFSIAAAGIGLILNMVLLPLMGIEGAAIASLAANAAVVAMIVHVSRRYVPFDICWTFIAKAVAASAVMPLIAYVIDPVDWTGALLTVGICIASYLAALYLLKGFGPLEKALFSMFRELARSKRA